MLPCRVNLTKHDKYMRTSAKFPLNMLLPFNVMEYTSSNFRSPTSLERKLQLAIKIEVFRIFLLDCTLQIALVTVLP